MSKSVIGAARTLAREVRAQEETLDEALAGQARLIGALLDARRTAGVSARFGTSAIDRAFDAIAHGRELRNAMLAVHQELAQINVRELAVGDVAECPEEGALAPLTLVATEQRAA